MKSFSKENIELRNELLNSDFTEEQVDRYYKAMMSEDKMEMLIELRDYYEYYDFIPFDYFEKMNEDQLREVLQRSLLFINEKFSKQSLIELVDDIMEDQEAALKNRNLKTVMSDYLPEEFIPYISYMQIGFFDIQGKDVEAYFIIHNPSSYQQIEDCIHKELILLPEEFLSDKPDMQILILEDNDGKEDDLLAAFTVDFSLPHVYDYYISYKTLPYALRFKNGQILERTKEDTEMSIGMSEKNLRVQYEQFQEIKAEWKSKKNRMQCIWKLQSYLSDYNIIINENCLDSMLYVHSDEGISSMKVFLNRYDRMSQDDDYYLNGYGNIEMLDNDNKVDLLLNSVENAGGFQNILTYDHSRNYVHEIGGKEKEDLIVICQKNNWLKHNGYEFQDGSLSEEEYGYNFMRCEKRLDLMNYMEHVSWAIRDGFLFEDMAFIQQVNGGDEFWTLINQNGKWIDYESVTFRPSIERGEFYTLIDKLHEEGIEAIQRNMKKTRKKGGLDDRQR